MASNFDFLRNVKKMQPIAKAAEEAEQAFQISTGACCLLSRRAADYALHWMLDNDGELQSDFLYEMDVDPNKAELMQMLTSFAFRSRIGQKAIENLHSIRMSGNDAAHDYKRKLEGEKAEKSLINLHYFLSCFNLMYNKDLANPSPKFDRSLLPERQAPKERARSGARKNEGLEFYHHATFSYALILLTADERENVKKVILEMVHNKKLNPGCLPIADAEDENIFMLPVDRFFKLYIVLYWRADVCNLLYVAGKEKALQWVKTIKCEVNTTTNDLQVFSAALPGSRDITPETDRIQENRGQPRTNRRHVRRRLFRHLLLAVFLTYIQ